MNQEYRIAVQAALDGEWDRAHVIVQEYGDVTACWIHAVLHKMEPDEANSRYWYARTRGKHYEDYADPAAELRAIAAQLEAGA